MLVIIENNSYVLTKPKSTDFSRIQGVFSSRRVSNLELVRNCSHLVT